MKLKTKITVHVLAILVAVGGVAAPVTLYLQRKAAISSFEQSAFAIAGVLERSLEREMMKADPAAVRHAVRHVAAISPVSRMLVVSNGQQVYASADLSEIGETRDDVYVREALASGQRVARTENMNGRNEISVVLPIANRPGCVPCHGDAPVLGAILIGLDRSPLDAQLKSQATIMVLMALLTFVAIWAALLFVFRRAVIKPLSSLASSAAKLARRDFSARAEVRKNDEVGAVAQAFNDMAERVQSYSEALERSRSDLEDRVAQRTAELERLYDELQKKEHARGVLLDRVLAAQEEERKRVARDLHDESAQALIMVMMGLSRTIKSLPDSAVVEKERLSTARAAIGDALDNLRRLIQDLRPDVLDQLGLLPAIRSLVSTRLTEQGIKTSVSFNGVEESEELPSAVQTVLFRVIQEAINNVLRHANATAVEVDLTRNDGHLSAVVVDNGSGFEVTDVLAQDDSWGLKGMKERVGMAGGELNIESGPGVGTRVSITIPVQGGR